MAQDGAGLRDKFGRLVRDLRVSVTDKCNFRCPYCMPAEIYGERYEFLPRSELLTFEEITRLAGIFVELGVTKIRLTGGEPLVRNGLEKLVARLSPLHGIDDLTLTTNGYLLAQKAQALRDAGLRRLTVSLDSLNDEVFKVMNGRGYSAERVLDGIRVAEGVGFSPIKINSVVQKGGKRPLGGRVGQAIQGDRAYRPIYRVYGRGEPEWVEAGPRGAGRGNRRDD